MTGNADLTVNEMWVEVETLLEEYKKKLCIKIQHNQQIEEILNLREIQLKTLDSTTANNYAYLLMQHSLYIQEQYNFHASKYAWAKHNLDIVVGKAASNYDKFSKWEEKKACVISENKYAKVLSDFIRETSIRMETLNFISRKIESMANIIKRREYERQNTG